MTVAREFAVMLPSVLLGLFALATALFLLSLQQLRRGRTGLYWRQRRQAGQRGGQLFIAALALYALTAAIAILSGLADIAYTELRNRLSADSDAPKGVSLPSATPTPRITLPPSPTPTFTATATFTLTPTASPSATASATPTPSLTPTATPTATATATFADAITVVPLADARPPNANAALRLITVARGVMNNQPLEADTQFAAGIRAIYVFMTYANMRPGDSWSRVLYRDGVAVQGSSYRWGQGATGETYFFFANADGYPPGEYAVRLFLGNAEASEITFFINDGL